ncbi:MAG: hypothetical protein EA383_10310 [Spirochaetaceae bacterium]|nr:MAG: hypothetical protein EA383_10310 [Spirochaetaceae bacterium]
MPAKKSDQSNNGAKTIAPKTSNWTSRPGLYVFSVIILVIIVVSFIGGPLLGQFASPGEYPVFGRYRGEAIEFAPGSFFQQALRDADQQMATQFGGDRQSLQYQYQVYRQAFERTILHMAVLMESRRGGMSVSRNRVTEQLAMLPRFLEDGRFSSAALDRTPQTEILSLRQTIEEQLIYDEFLRDVLQGFVYSTEEARFFADQARLERRFDVARFGFDAFPAENVRSFADTNADLFRTVEVSSITIGVDQTALEEIRRQYVDEEASFEELAREFSLDRYAQDGGRRGSLYSYELEQLILSQSDVEALFSADTGDVSGIIDTQDGLAVFRVDRAGEPADLSDDDVIADLRAYIEQFERAVIEDFFFDEAERLVALTRDGLSFEEAAQTVAARVQETNFFPLNFGSLPFLPQLELAGGGRLPGAMSDEGFLRTAFSLQQDEVSDPILLNDDLVVLRLVEQRELDSVDLDEIGEFMPFYFQQLQAGSFERMLLDPAHIEDNFNQTFQRLFIGP